MLPTAHHRSAPSLSQPPLADISVGYVAGRSMCFQFLRFYVE